MTSESPLTNRPVVPPQSQIGQITLLGRSLGATDLSQGFPDNDPPAEITELFQEVSRRPGSHQYADPRGVSLLRRNLARKLEAENGITANPDREVVVTCGATEALMSTFRALFQPGERILTFTPAYENYFLQAAAAGLQIETLELQEPHFALPKDELEAACSDGIRAILICNPCNPTGKVFSYDELLYIVGLAVRYNLLLIADETYERFIWKGRHVSIGSLPGALDRTITLASLGKTFSVTGWRVGYAVAHENWLQPIARMHELTTFGASHPFQLTLAHALELPESFHTTQLLAYAERKANLMNALLAAGFKPWDPAGAYFLWCDYSQLSSDSDFVFAKNLIRDARVAGVPGKVFFAPSTSSPKRIRFTFSKSLATIQEAASRVISADLKSDSHKVPVQQ